jgi:hypothetical protein
MRLIALLSSTGCRVCPDLRAASSIFASSFGLLDSAVCHQPARALRQGAADDDDHQCQQRAHEEGKPPAHVDREGVEEDQRRERPEDGAGPVGAVDPDVDSAAVPRRHHFVDRRVDRRVLATDAHAGDEPRPVEEQQPPGVMPGDERSGAGPEQIQQQGHDEQPLAAQPVGHLAEYQGPHHLADEVHRRDQSDLGRGHPKRFRAAQNPGHRARDSDLQPVQNPRGAQATHHPGVEWAPVQPVQPGRDGRPDRHLFRGDCHDGSLSPYQRYSFTATAPRAARRGQVAPRLR